MKKYNYINLTGLALLMAGFVGCGSESKTQATSPVSGEASFGVTREPCSTFRGAFGKGFFGIEALSLHKSDCGTGNYRYYLTDGYGTERASYCCDNEIASGSAIGVRVQSNGLWDQDAQYVTTRNDGQGYNVK